MKHVLVFLLGSASMITHTMDRKQAEPIVIQYTNNGNCIIARHISSIGNLNYLTTKIIKNIRRGTFLIHGKLKSRSSETITVQPSYSTIALLKEEIAQFERQFQG